MIDTLTVIATTISLIGLLSVMALMWRENIYLTRKVKILQVALREERRKVQFSMRDMETYQALKHLFNLSNAKSGHDSFP